MKTRTQAAKRGSKNKASSQVRTNPKPIRAKTEASPAEFKIVRLRECPLDQPTMDTPGVVADFWRKHVPNSASFDPDRECLCVFILNTRRRLVGFQIVAHGALDSVAVTSRDVFRFAIHQNAASIIVAHNHPSGDPSPSASDITITKKLAAAGEFLGIELCDHIIMGRPAKDRPKDFASLRELGGFMAVPAHTEGEGLRAAKRNADLEQTAYDTIAFMDLMEARLETLYEQSGYVDHGTLGSGLSSLKNLVCDRLLVCSLGPRKEPPASQSRAAAAA